MKLKVLKGNFFYPVEIKTMNKNRQPETHTYTDVNST
jgi:hypothetical protein